MKLKDKIKSYSFWVSLTSAIILILKILGNRFGFSVDETMIGDLFTALCSILVLLGIIVPPSGTTTQNNINDKNTLSNESNLEQDEKQEESTCIINNETKIDSEAEKLDEDPATKSDNISIVNKEAVFQETEISQNEQNLNFGNEAINIIDTHNDSSNNISENNSIEIKNKDNTDLKQMFFEIKEKFSDNLDLYIFELQEEIRKTREGM